MNPVMGNGRMFIDTLTRDRTGWVVSKIVVVVSEGPKITQRGSDDDSECGVVDGSLNSWIILWTGHLR